MFPTVVTVQGEIDLHKGAPFGPFGFTDEMQPGFLRSAIGFLGVALDAGANDVFPCGRPAAVAGDNVVEVQVFPVKNVTAILAGVFIALKDVVARELHFFLRQPVIHEQQDDARNLDAEGNGMDGFVMGRINGHVAPFAEIKGAKGTVIGVDDDLGLSLEEQSQGATSGANINGLPEPIQHKHMLIERSVHNQRREIIRTDDSGQCHPGHGKVAVG